MTENEILTLIIAGVAAYATVANMFYQRQLYKLELMKTIAKSEK